MRKELEQIIFLGKLTDTVEIFGKTWTLQTINLAEQTEIVKKINSKDESVNIITLKQMLLQKALMSIDDVEFESEKERAEFVSKLPLAVVDRLFLKYNDMNNAINKVVTPEEQEEIKN